jgi:hypothetical protein
MVERRAESQTGNLTPDHQKSGIDLVSVCVGGVQHTVGKLLRRATSLLQTSSQLEVGAVGAKSYERPKPRESKPGQFRDLLWESREKVSFRCGHGEVMQSILYGGRWWLPPSSGCGESSEVMLPVACPNTKRVPRGELTHSWLVLCRKQVSE